MTGHLLTRTDSTTAGAATPTGGRIRRIARLLAIASVVVGSVVGARSVHANSQTWSAPAAIPSALTQAGPALAVYDKKLYAAWVGKTPSKQIWYSAWDGSTWTAQKRVPIGATTNGPALGVYNGKLYVAWLGTGSPHHLWYADFNGKTWSSQAEVPTGLAAPYTAPALAAFNGDLYLAWLGNSSPNAAIWYSAFNGTTWSAQTTIPSSLTHGVIGEEDNPALVAYEGSLYASWDASPSCGTASQMCVSVSTFDGTTWTGPSNFLAPCCSAYNAESGPTLAVYGVDLYLAYFDNYLSEVLYTDYNGSTWSSWLAIPGSFSATCEQPALATYSGGVFAAWQQSSGTSCSINGSIDVVEGP